MNPEVQNDHTSSEPVIGFANGVPFNPAEIDANQALELPVSGRSKMLKRYKRTLTALGMLLGLGLYIGLAFLSFLTPYESLSFIMGLSLIAAVPAGIVLAVSFIVYFFADTFQKPKLTVDAESPDPSTAK